MHQELTSQVEGIVRLYLIPMAWKVAGGIAVWLIGNYAIKFLRGGLRRTMRLRHIDVTLARYLDTSTTVVLQLLVLIAVLGVLGVETTSFAALLAAAGIAIGAAWSGLLSNFAAGLFLLTFRPFRVGDTIAASGITGTVREIGLFVTSIDTPDHVLTFVGNNKLFSDNVQNFSANDFRRVDLTAQLPPVLDIERAMASLRSSLTSIPHVLTKPRPDPDDHAGRLHAGGAAVLSQRSLLAGVLRYQSRHRPDADGEVGEPISDPLAIGRLSGDRPKVPVR